MSATIQRVILVWLGDDVSAERGPALASALVDALMSALTSASGETQTECEVGVKRLADQGFDIAVRMTFSDDSARADFDARFGDLVDATVGPEAGGIKQYDFLAVGP